MKEKTASHERHEPAKRTKQPTILAIIPARGGSKRLPRKNVKPLLGKPLIAYSVEQGKQASCAMRVVVSTDDPEIKKISLKYGAEVLDRPVELATDTATTMSVLHHVVKTLQAQGFFPDIVVLLQPTCPMRLPEDIDACIKKLIETGADSVVSVREIDEPPHWMMQLGDGDRTSLFMKEQITRKQDIPELYILNGAVYAIKTDVLLKQEWYVMGPDNRAYIMPRDRSYDIDNQEDFELVEFLMRKRKE